MVKLSVTETYRAETRDEAEDFIRAERVNNGGQYDVTKASYVHKEKKSKGEVIDQCEVVSITKVYCDVWSAE